MTPGHPVDQDMDRLVTSPGRPVALRVQGRVTAPERNLLDWPLVRPALANLMAVGLLVTRALEAQVAGPRDRWQV